MDIVCAVLPYGVDAVIVDNVLVLSLIGGLVKRRRDRQRPPNETEDPDPADGDSVALVAIRSRPEAS